MSSIPQDQIKSKRGVSRAPLQRVKQVLKLNSNLKTTSIKCSGIDKKESPYEVPTCGIQNMRIGKENKDPNSRGISAISTVVSSSSDHDKTLVLDNLLELDTHHGTKITTSSSTFTKAPRKEIHDNHIHSTEAGIDALSSFADLSPLSSPSFTNNNSSPSSASENLKSSSSGRDRSKSFSTIEQESERLWNSISMNQQLRLSTSPCNSNDDEESSIIPDGRRNPVPDEYFFPNKSFSGEEEQLYGIDILGVSGIYEKIEEGLVVDDDYVRGYNDQTDGDIEDINSLTVDMSAFTELCSLDNFKSAVDEFTTK